MAEIKIAAETRTEFGKGAARRIRRDDKVPAVLYEHGADPMHLTLPGHQLMMALKNSNALLTIDVDGDQHLAIPKQVQRDPIRGFIEHADLLIVRKGEKVTVDVRIHLVGEAAPGTLVVTEHNVVTVEAEATDIPEFFEVSIEGLEVGEQIHSRDITLPSGSTLAGDGDMMIVNIINQPTIEEVEAELDEAAAEAGEDVREAESAEGDAGSEGDAEAAESSENE